MTDPRALADPRALTDEQSVLAGRWSRLAFALGHEAASRRPRLADELRGAAVFGLLDAARAYDPRKGTGAEKVVPFGIWATIVIQRRIRQQVRLEHRQVRDRRRESGADVPEAAAADDRPEPLPEGLVEHALSLLDDRQASAVRLCVIDGLTLREAGRRLGASPESVRGRKRKALAVLAGSSWLAEFGGVA